VLQENIKIGQGFELNIFKIALFVLTFPNSFLVSKILPIWENCIIFFTST